MKKISLLLTLILSTSCFFASAEIPLQTLCPSGIESLLRAENYLLNHKNATYKLTARVASDNYEKMSFTYDNLDRIVSILDSSDMRVVDSVKYNTQNQIVRIDGYQWMSSYWMHVYYVEYTYDAYGNRISRTNYNNFGNVFEIGGIYQYIFNNQNVLTNHNLFLGDTSAASLYETGVYNYDAQGRLVTAITNQGFGTLDSAGKTRYSYNSAGKLSRKDFYMYDNGWYLDSYEEFVYDNKGNCIEHNTKDNNGDYTERRLYSYNLTIEDADVMMPYASPELTLPEQFTDANARSLEQWYTLDDNHVLQYVCDYHYLYNGQPVGIASHSFVGSFIIYPNPTADAVTIFASEVSPIKNLFVFDINGRMIEKIETRNTNTRVNTSSYNPGIYMVKAVFENGDSAYSKMIKE